MSQSNRNCRDVPILCEWEEPRCLAVVCEFGCLLKLTHEGFEVAFPDDRPLDCVIAQATLHEAGKPRNVVLQGRELRRIAQRIRRMKDWHADVTDFGILYDLSVELSNLRLATEKRLGSGDSSGDDVTGL